MGAAFAYQKGNHMDAFWAAIEAQLDLLKTAKSADEVVTILGGKQVGVAAGDAFFAGGGGNGSIAGVLREAGWSVVWFKADYHWCMQAPDGSQLTYVEGDVYRRNQRPLPARGSSSYPKGTSP
jgi:hypothetical protein